MPRTFHHSLIPHYHTMARTGWRGGKSLMMRWWANPTTSNIALSVVGNVDNGAISENADSFSIGADAGGNYCTFLTGDSDGDDCWIGTTSGFYTVRGLSDFYHMARFALPAAMTNVRFFVGLTPYGNRTLINNADNPSANQIGIQFSSSRDTNLQFVSSPGDMGASQTLTDTGVAPATDVIYQLEQEFSSDGTSVRGRLTNVGTGSVLWGDTTVTATLPAATTELSPFIGAKTSTTADATMRFYKHEVWA